VQAGFAASSRRIDSLVRDVVVHQQGTISDPARHAPSGGAGLWIYREYEYD
jgi:hypothetical protein